jgi:Na+/proline symporter
VLLTLVIAYLLVTIAIGLVAAKRVKNSADFAIAGRHLPLAMIVTTTFATWFGSETVLGIPAKFVNSGRRSVWCGQLFDLGGFVFCWQVVPHELAHHQ